jgi:hypothetical protein
MMIKKVFNNPVYFLLSACLLLTPITGCGGGTDATTPTVPLGQAIPLVNASFEEKNTVLGNCVSGWGCELHVDPVSFRFSLDTQFSVEGAQSLLIERIKLEPYALAGQSIRVIDYIGRRMTLTAYIRTDGVAENGGGLYYRIGGLTSNMSDDYMATDTQLILGTQEWKQLKMDFTIPLNARVLTVGAILQGPGKMWVDNVSLSVAP